MKLSYSRIDNTDSVIILLNPEGERVELHLKPLSDNLYALIALAGPDQALPQRCKCQGPFQDFAQSQGAMKAITAALQEEGFQVFGKEVSIWSLHCQAVSQQMRQQRDAHSVDSTYVPEIIW